MAVPDGGPSVFLCSKGVADESESQSVGQLFESQKNPILMACPNCSGSIGIVIGVFYREHGRPHFHAVYGEFEAVIDIETGDVISGRLGKRAMGLISEWQSAHTAELAENWELAR